MRTRPDAARLPHGRLGAQNTHPGTGETASELAPTARAERRFASRAKRGD